MTIVQLEERIARHPHSPLFARLASEYLNVGRVEEAKQLCSRGLERFPSYPTAHLILAKCFHAEQNYMEALHHIRRASISLPDFAHLQKIYDEWESISIEQTTEFRNDVVEHPPQEEPLTIEAAAQQGEAIPEIAERREAEIMEQSVPPIWTEAVSETEQPPAAEMEMILQAIAPSSEAALDVPPSDIEVSQRTEIAEPTNTNLSEVESRQEIQVQKIPGITSVVPQMEPAAEDVSHAEGRIVSKTLAEIYASQGAFSEAIITYRLLREQRPDQLTELDKRIEELRAKLQEKSTI